ncbi:hypothetical protein CH63R_06405 [Colletotrichum higginsianum IMI 349063]|uniref:Uncharacterized protein n=1 Tax=Colletotrichum higginsianum (strain IMI 349063) TaxID=759273 RepID=A0A1B7YF38_COLHI|nr:hypothetical protein CH63R_06405 [Colletotrichum higginsianum IMI 349063]OBR10713.1 hypothetical protein CH63R_06405 [Colletotrichum higginsianum IMI 349063]
MQGKALRTTRGKVSWVLSLSTFRTLGRGGFGPEGAGMRRPGERWDNSSSRFVSSAACARPATRANDELTGYDTTKPSPRVTQ